MRTKKKLLMALALVCCAILLVAGSIAGTVAYLTATDSVTNTFTVGNVSITLDESDVSAANPATAPRVKANTYKLLPGQTYAKDPVVHVGAKSEESYVFVKVVNTLSGIEDSSDTIASQLAANKWTIKVSENTTTEVVNDVTITTVTAVYAYETTITNDTDVAKDYPVFSSVTIDNTVTNATLAAYENKTVAVTAYAIQAAGFSGANAVADAWTAVSTAHP